MVKRQEQAGEKIDLGFVRLGDEVYILDVDCVYDIYPVKQITPVPHVPDWVRGVSNLRGTILSVIELSRFLELPVPDSQAEREDLASLVIVKTPEMECALLVDELMAVESLSEAHIKAPSDLVRGLRPESVQGVVDINGEEGNSTAIRLNIQAILADSRLVVNQEAL